MEAWLAEKKCMNPFNTLNLSWKLGSDPRTRTQLTDPTYQELTEQLWNKPFNLDTKLQNPWSWLPYSQRPPQSPCGQYAWRGGSCDICTTTSSPKADQARAQGRRLFQRSSRHWKTEPGADKEKGFDTTLKLHDRATGLESTNMIYMTNQAAMFFAKGDSGECRELCEKTTKVGQKDYQQMARVYARIGNSYFKEEKYQDTIHFHNKSPTEHWILGVLQKCQQSTELSSLCYPAASRSLVYIS